MIDIKSFSKPKKSGNGSGGGSSSVTYLSGIASEAAHASRADKAKKAEVAEQANVANRASSAQTANYASKAGEVDIESETLQKFLRKDDPAEGKENVAEEVHRKVDFKKAATFEEAADMLKKFTAHELAAFLKGFTIAGQFGIDEYGDMILNTIKSLKYNNAAEQGFSIEKEDPNRDEYHQYITNLTVWGKMTMNELEVMKRTYAGGTIYLSPAGGKIAKVVPVSSWDDDESEWHETSEDMCVGWKCYLLADDGTAATENLWREGDQVRCQTMGRIAAGGIGQGSAANKSYWRTILKHGVSQQNEKIYDHKMDHELFGGQRFAWIVIGKHSVQLDEYAEENAPAETRDIPEEGDVIVLDGSRTDPDRQNVFLLESHGSYAPRLVGYHGIDSYSHANKDVCDVSPKGVQVRSEYFKLLAQGSNTSTVEIPNFRGAWNAATQYYKNDQVSHNNAVWVCVADSGVNVTDEPSDDTKYWKKVLVGGKGEKGDDAVSYILEASPGYIRLNSDGSIDYTNGYIDKGDEYESDKYLVVRGYKVAKGVRDNRFSTEANPVTLRLTINDGSAYHEYTPSDGDSVSIDFEPKYEDSYYSMLQEISHSGLNSVRVDLCEGIEYDASKILATCDIPIIRNGKDVVSVLVENAPLVFDTDDNGTVSSNVTKTAKVKVMKGSTNVTNDCSDVYSIDSMCVNCKCNVIKDGVNECINVSIKGEWIFKDDIIVNEASQGSVSKTSGYAVARLTYAGVVYFAQVPFSVNVAKFTGVVAFNNKSYKIQFEELSKNAATKKELMDATSKFEQTAREISLSVSEKSIGRRNLLVGSAFQHDDNNRVISDGAKIEMNSGYQGTNCIHVNDTTEAGSPHYVGAYWDGSQNGRSIKIEKGKKYTMSCFYKTNDINAKFCLEAIYTDKQANAKRLGRPTCLSPNNFIVKNVKQWELFTTVIDTTNAESDYIAFNFWEACNVSAGQIEAWICRPMVEEGDTYNGWTLSTEDYDYIGGNMLENTLSLDKSGTLYDVNGTLTPLGFGESTSIYKSFTYKLKGIVSSFSQLPSYGNMYGDTYYVSNTQTCYKYNGSEFENVGNDYYYNVLEWRKLGSEGFVPFGLEANKDYVFSFMAKGTGKLTAYFYYPETNVFIESSLGETATRIDGAANFQLTSDWKKYWVHWRPSDSSHKYVLLRLNRTIQGSAGDAPITNCYIAQPKLEAGAVVTEYTERKSDLVDKATLKKAGIEIKSDEVILYGDKIRVDNNGQTAAMFIGGKLNAAFIDADKIEVKHLWAKSNDGASKVGYFGNTEEDACKIGDYTVAPLFIGGATAKESPFYVTSKGAMHAMSGKIGYFTISPNGELMYDDGYTDVARRPFGLSKNALYFTHTTNHKDNDVIVWVGRVNFSASSTGTPPLVSDIWIEDKENTRDESKACLFLSAEGYTGEDTDPMGNLMGNFAIYAKKGTYAGFRPAVRIARKSCRLTDMDCVIYVSGTGVYLTLPDNPQKGQYYKFIQGAGVFHIKSSSKNIYNNVNGVTNDFDSASYNQTTEIIWLGDHWRINWFREVVGK